MNPADPLEMAILVPVTCAARVLESRSTRVRASVLVVNLFVATGLVTACGDDASLPAGPGTNPTFDIAPNGGCVPEATTTQQDSTETILVNFTVPSGGCAIDGSPYGIGFGPWDTEYFFNNKVWTACSNGVGNCMSVTNVPSPQHWAQNHHAPSQDFMEFDPPVRSVEFSYSGIRPRCHEEPDCPDTFYVYAYTRGSNGWLGWVVDQAALRTNYWGDPPGDVWEPVQLTSSTDNIAWLYIDGMILIDDLKITRAKPPEIECDTVVRGEETTCRIVDPSSVGSVSGWQWEGDVFFNAGTTITSAISSTTWQGVAVASGLVSAFVEIDGSPTILSGPLQVLDRTGSAWTWDESKWYFAWDSASAVMCAYDDYEMPAGARLAVNRRATSCVPTENVSIEPSVLSDPWDGYENAQVQGGPNDGLWYVGAAFYYMDRMAERNPYLTPAGPADTLTNSHDLRTCRDALGLGKKDPVIVNFHTYNTVCRDFSLTPFFQGIWDHEGFGTKGKGTPAANGHEERRRYAAGLPQNDPYALIEDKVTISDTLLHSAVTNAVDGADQFIREMAGDHTFVRDNFVAPGNKCGRAWVYHILDARYLKIEIRQLVDIEEWDCI